MSGNRDVSCSTCHHPRLATTDRLTMNRGVYGVGIGPQRVGAAVGGRTTQPLWNLHKLQKGLAVDHKVPLAADGYVYPLGGPFIPFAWQDEAFDPDMKAAAGQAMMPEVTDQEMLGFPGDNDFTDECPQDDPPFGLVLCAWGKMMERLGAIPEYVEMFEAAYPGVDFEDMHFAYAGNAIAAYEFRAFFSDDTPWDRFVGRFDPTTGAVTPGDDDALTLQQLAGRVASSTPTSAIARRVTRATRSPTRTFTRRCSRNLGRATRCRAGTGRAGSTITGACG
ncbi:cytochrome c peroxidase [Nannocystis pusilla]|uniref:cytochrome c peroxidase n=1 Tax=Nannocystis pusilla TaxID=889268 RepID=UPI003B7EFFDB